MVEKSENKIAGYSFSDLHDYKEAKREAETVEYIKANTDLSDLNKILKLYHKLVERKTLKTVVGFEFLNELKVKILKEGIVNQQNLPPISVTRDEKLPRVYDNAFVHEQEKRHMEMIEDYKIKLRNSRIISGFLAIIIILMIIIAILSDRSAYSIRENELLDKYASWQEELEAREHALEEKENSQ